MQIPPWKYRDENFCRLLNDTNKRCKIAIQKGLFNKLPNKSPSLVVRKGGIVTSPKRSLNESLKRQAIQQLQQSMNNSAGQNATFPSIFKGHSINNDGTLDEDFIKFSESEIQEVANRSIIDPPPGFQNPQRRMIPIIQTPGRNHNSPNSSFDQPLKVSTPTRLHPRVSRLKTSTPFRYGLTPKRNPDQSFSITLPSTERSSIRRITCNENFTPRNLTSLIEIIDALPAIDASNAYHSISLSSRSANVTPGKYELFKIMR